MLHRDFSHDLCRDNSQRFAARAIAARNTSPLSRPTARLILPPPSQDPHVHFEKGQYYYCESSPSGIFVRVAGNFLDFGGASRRRVWSPPRRGPASRNLWAPELHRVDGRCHIYFAADDGQNAHHRMWVLAATTDDPAGPYELAGELSTDGWAIDGTTFVAHHSLRYFVWSGWPGKRDGQQNLYLAPMKSAVELAGPRTLILTPEAIWEQSGLPICEGPQILARGGRTFLIYSASGSWTADYCLGALELVGEDPTTPTAWRKLGCVFSRNRHAWGVGHCGFVTSPDGNDDWILYHAKTSRRPGWTDREVRAQRFGWDAEGYPLFADPLPIGASVTPVDSRRGAKPAA